MSREHIKALEELEDMRTEGRISQAQYDVHKASLLAEASRPRIPLATRLVLFVVICAVLFLLIRLIVT